MRNIKIENTCELNMVIHDYISGTPVQLDQEVNVCIGCKNAT